MCDSGFGVGVSDVNGSSVVCGVGSSRPMKSFMGCAPASGSLSNSWRCVSEMSDMEETGVSGSDVWEASS